MSQWLNLRAWHDEGTLGGALYRNLKQADEALGRCASIQPLHDNMRLGNGIHPVRNTIKA